MNWKKLIYLAVGTAAGAFAYRYYRQEKEILFDHTIHTNFDTDTLWDFIHTAFTDSNKSPIWVHQLETLETAGILQAGSYVQATYHTPLGDKAKTYRIHDLEEGKWLTYETEDPENPLQGGAIIKIVQGIQGADLQWQGSYKFKGMPQEALFFKLYFETRFFELLAQNIKAIEPLPQGLEIIEAI
ncbi:MAG: hypothetical protein JJT94_03480 [Bernardetiaceae bacterium]|nr:hypothetical protein [Bernardetiaceae bacterium]